VICWSCLQLGVAGFNGCGGVAVAGVDGADGGQGLCHLLHLAHHHLVAPSLLLGALHHLLDRAAYGLTPAGRWHLLQLVAAPLFERQAAAHPPFPGPGDGLRRRRALLHQVGLARVHGLPFLVSSLAAEVLEW
jgi:hypothetical protein